VIGLSWSGGKDSALALEKLRSTGQAPGLLLSTVDEERGVVAHHDTPLTLLRAQAESVGLPLVEVLIPPAASNDTTYEERMAEAFEGPLAEVSGIAFGDLFLEDLREYREERMKEIGRAAVFPLWGSDTRALAAEFTGRYEATVCAIDLEQLPGLDPGVPYDRKFLDALPSSADPCGEMGEFHTFVHDGPVFSAPVTFALGGMDISVDGRFSYANMAPEAD